MKIYSPEDNHSAVPSVENFRNFYLDSSVVSMESLGQYFQKVRDTFNTIGSAIASDKDKFIQDTLSTKNEVIYVSREVSYADFRHQSASRPEQFSELFIDYLEELTEISEAAYGSVGRSLKNLKMAVAGFINDYQEGQVSTLYGAAYFGQERRVIEDLKKRDQKFYRLPQNKTKTTAQSVIKSMTDFEKIYPLIDNVAGWLNETHSKELEKQVRDNVEMIDTLVEQNIRTGTLTKSEHIKKDLIDAIDQTARAVEFYAALYAEFFAICSSFKSLTETLIDTK